MPQPSLTQQFLTEQYTPGHVHAEPTEGRTLPPPRGGIHPSKGDSNYNPNIQNARVPWKNKVQSKDRGAEAGSDYVGWSERLLLCPEGGMASTG